MRLLSLYVSIFYHFYIPIYNYFNSIPSLTIYISYSIHSFLYVTYIYIKSRSSLKNCSLWNSEEGEHLSLGNHPPCTMCHPVPLLIQGRFDLTSSQV